VHLSPLPSQAAIGLSQYSPRLNARLPIARLLAINTTSRTGAFHREDLSYSATITFSHDATGVAIAVAVSSAQCSSPTPLRRLAPFPRPRGFALCPSPFFPLARCHVRCCFVGPPLKPVGPHEGESVTSHIFIFCLRGDFRARHGPRRSLPLSTPVAPPVHGTVPTARAS
jgi:hypothetical protein